MLPPFMSCSLAPSSTMMSCTVHSPMDSLTQPSCIVVYIECNPAQEAPHLSSLWVYAQTSWVLSSPPSQSPLVWWFVLGLPWVASVTGFMLRNNSPFSYTLLSHICLLGMLVNTSNTPMKPLSGEVFLGSPEILFHGYIGTSRKSSLLCCCPRSTHHKFNSLHLPLHSLLSLTALPISSFSTTATVW